MSEPGRAASPAFVLDCGADEAICEDPCFEVTDLGMSFNTQWEFSVGTQLSIALTTPATDGTQSRISCEGTVVSCGPVEHGCHRVVLMFDEETPGKAEALRTAAALMAAKPTRLHG